MFEKEAEEYADVPFSPKTDSELMALCFKDGAEFGYNKCKEELNQKGLALQSDMDKTIEQNIALKKELDKANEWHYVKDGLPKDNEYVLIYTDLNNCYVAKKVENHFMSKGWGFIPMSTVVAWKEIVLPKGE